MKYYVAMKNDETGAHGVAWANGICNIVESMVPFWLQEINRCLVCMSKTRG